METRTMVDGRQEYKQLEMDFVVDRFDSRWYIQSSYSIPDPAKMEQETRPFKKLRDSFRRVLIVGNNVRPWFNDEDVLIVEIKDFLLDETLMGR